MEPPKEEEERYKSLKTISQVCSVKSSSNSSRSSSSAAALRARAKAEAAKIKVSYAEKEAAVMREKAQIEEQQKRMSAETDRRKAEMEASLYVLQMQKEAVVASTEAAVYEAAADLEEGCLREPTEIDKAQRTSEYVQKHSLVQYAQQLSPDSYMQHSVSRENIPTQHNTTGPTLLDYSPMVEREHLQSESNQMPHVNNTMTHTCLGDYKPIPASIPDMTKYLIKKEMVSSGLIKFDDCPENYWAWKTSFQDVTRDLSLTAREELDLLTKWLGPESSAQAKRIRSVHVHNPTAGVIMLWQRLEDCYGCPEVIEHALLRRLGSFPHISNKDTQRLRELGDLLLEMESAKASGLLPGLAYLDTARGVNPIVEKLPYGLQERWITQGSKYKEDHHASFPPFSFFVRFICNYAKTRNDPSFAFFSSSSTSYNKPSHQAKSGVKFSNTASVSVKKTEVSATTPAPAFNTVGWKVEEPDKQCPIHRKPHPLSKCRGFRSKHIDDRKAYLKEMSICFRCCASTKHIAIDCKVAVRCRECESDKHISILHPGPAPWSAEATANAQEQGGEPEENTSLVVNSKCTDICGKDLRPRSCSKICLVSVYPADHPDKAHRVYAVLDDQSNRSLAKSQFFDLFGINGNSSPYTLRTCSGVTEMAGRKANRFVVESFDGKTKVALPTLIECNALPDDRTEIPTPEITQYFSHLIPVLDKIPPLDPNAAILLLLGRDVLSVHKVREQYNGPHDTPYAQRLDLGWVIVGEICLDGAHRKPNVNVYKTNVLHNGRASFLTPCTKSVHLKEKYASPLMQYSPMSTSNSAVLRTLSADTDSLGNDVFHRTPDDEKLTLSVEDKAFLKIMDNGMHIDEENHLVAPLPFRSSRRSLPNNREQSLQRLSSLHRNFLKKPDLREDFLDFMQRVFDNHQAEPAPPLQQGEECWYLPIFGIYHPQKPGKIRVVFDSSAKYRGISLNDVLLSGPDLNNTLLGVLLRFRKERVAITADVEQMFYCFKVREDHRDFLRFCWHKDNDLDKEIIDYRMTVHVFGNSPSPAVATYGLRMAAEHGEAEHGSDARAFVLKNFYVDDGLASVSSESEAVSLMKRTKDMLGEYNLRLHKIASNSGLVMDAFQPEDKAKDLKDLDIGTDPLPLQRSLGISWNLKSDSFTFQVSQEVKPFTRRGILSTVNSLYDPLGFVSPITMQGKALVRELSSEQHDWDSPLSTAKESKWKAWTQSLKELEHLHIKRTYVPVSLVEAQQIELCIFSDASILAIAAVAYLRVTDTHGQCHVGLVMSKSKLAPFPAHTVPRLELCAAVLAVELAELIKEEIDVKISAMKFFTDSRVVLGYIHNTSRRFHMYVANRVARIRKSTMSNQWNYVSSDHNPADHGTRPMLAADLPTTTWFSGPAFLSRFDTAEDNHSESFNLVEPDTDQEIRSQVTTLVTKAMDRPLGSHRFQRFSTWKSLVRSIATLIHIAKSFSHVSHTNSCKGWHCCSKPCNSEVSQAKSFIIRATQQDVYKEEFESLTQGGKVSRHSALKKLDPFLDKEQLMRVGGRVRSADLTDQEKHPLILSANHHIANLLVHHHHTQVAHQGRHFTDGALRTAGLWIVGGKRLVSSVIFKCVTCRKLRGRFEIQKMSDLPSDRVSVDPPFTHVGLDVFGPWSVVTRRTRGNSAESKRWAVIFSCLSTRAVHLEVIESMSTSSFINALRRFLSIRGPVRHLRSDRGTNFIGACKELQINTKDPEIKSYLQDQGCTWTFNAPHSSHMGGAWERMIGIARRILDALLLKNNSTRCTHEVLTTLMAEVMAIMNSRPLVPVSTDPEMSEILSPAMLLTQKASVAPAPPGDFQMDFLCRNQWRQVQSLADSFWKRWRQEYLATLQPRRKWSEEKPNIREGDVVLLKDIQVKRSEWPVGLVVKVIPSRDSRVRKVMVKTIRQEAAKEYLRPISDLVLLLSGNDQKE